MERSITQIFAARKNDELVKIATQIKDMAEGVSNVDAKQAEKLHSAILRVLDAAHILRTIALEGVEVN